MRWMIVGALVLSVSACGRWKGDGNDEAVPDPIGPAIGMKKSFGVPVMLAGEQADENLQHNRQAETAEHEEGHHGAPAHHGSEVAPKGVAHGEEHKAVEHKAEH